MRTAIAKTLGFPAGDFAQAFEALKEARKALAVDALGQLQFADRLVLPPGSATAPGLLARLEAQGAKTSVMDLTQPEAVAEIDGWVKEATKGAIPALLITPLDDPAFDAMRFKGQWKTVFDPQLSRPAPFKDLDARAELLPALDALGLEEARRSPRALEAFGKGTLLSRVLQRAMIDVDEEGAEAAAATAAMATRSLKAEVTLQMNVDKPFVFALRDRDSGAILIAGYVGRPPLVAKRK
jgi:serine protease inhibitor